jgi:SEC-C motif
MFQDQAESLISEYAASEHFLFLQGPAKEGAESVLTAFFRRAGELGRGTLQDFKGRDMEDVLLNSMPRLDMPVALKKAVPDILDGFFAFLKDTGRFPPAGGWRMGLDIVRGKYLESLRADGSVKGTTFKKNYTDVGRNDPCPCGSGQKFKKCCMPLIQ